MPSADERTFRDITGADTFRQVMGNLERADRNSTIIVIVHERNREELAFTVSRLAVRGFRHFGFQPAYGMARSEVELAAKAIERIWAAYPHLDAGELFRAGEAFHHSFPLERRELCKGYAEAACC